MVVAVVPVAILVGWQ